jgi:DNA-binding LacI/PurR family transcriptional regulator
VACGYSPSSNKVAWSWPGRRFIDNAWSVTYDHFSETVSPTCLFCTMATIRNVARKAGVSIATVSRVVNGSTAVAPELRDRVLEAVNLCGYSPTVGRRSAASIALVYTGPFSIGSPYDAACLDGIVSAMLESAFDLKIVHLRRDMNAEETYSQFFFRKGIRGAILRSTAADREVARAVADEGFPAVVLGDHFDDSRLSFAYNQSRTASGEAIEHLISLGHRRIAIATNDTDDGDHLDRLEAYRQTLEATGIYDQSMEFRVPAHRLDGAQLLRKMMSLNSPPTAVFITDPLTAAGAINEAHKLGLRIPDELSILGFDDSESRQMVFPIMTAVCQDSRELGRAAFDLLLDYCGPQHATRETASPRSVLGKAWLEINHTTGRAPRQATRVLPSGQRLASAG